LHEEITHYEERRESIDASHETTRYELTKPQPASDICLSEYIKPTKSQNIIKQQSRNISALGYGNLRADYPLELVEFERRAPMSEDIVIDILYCGVCHSDRIINHYINVF
jgi:hypothetical protein